MKRMQREALDDSMRRFDTHLTNDIIQWIDALKQQGRMIPTELLMAVCRFDNWRLLKTNNPKCKVD